MLSQRLFVPAVLSVLACVSLCAQTADIAVDLNTDTRASNPKLGTEFNGEVYFQADTGAHGVELWKSDGTESGTVLVKDINQGADSSNPRFFAVLGNELYFVADDGVHGAELWVTDGTTSGTQLFMDLMPGSAGGVINSMESHNGELYFQAVNSSGAELWKSDGSPAGTGMVVDAAPGYDSSGPFNMTSTSIGLIYSATTPSTGRELWLSDGTAAGTSMVKDIVAGPDGSNPYAFTDIGGTVFFLILVGTTTELWTTDGTSAGTQFTAIVRDTPYTSIPVSTAAFNNELYFQGGMFTNSQLWKSDGTAAGTVAVTNLVFGGVNNLHVVGNELMFSAPDSSGHPALYKSDGTSVGTSIVKTLSSSSSVPGPFPTMTTWDGKLVFDVAPSGSYALPSGVWISDGTAAGTDLLTNLYSGPSVTEAATPVAFGSALLFNAHLQDVGTELFRLDASTQSYSLLRDINEATHSSNMKLLTEFNGSLYFLAREHDTLSEPWKLWRSDGTPSGTTQIVENHFSAIRVVNNQLFLMDSGDLWVSDGTAAGTTYVTTMWSGSSMLYPANEHTMVYDGRMYVTMPGSGSPNTVYVTDGTVSGTNSFDQFAPGLDLTNAGTFVGYDGVVYFSANDGINGWELWRTDGTSNGTFMVKDINVGTEGSGPAWFTEYKGELYFSADDGVHGEELWKTDGTTAGTVLVMDLEGGAGSSLTTYEAQWPAFHVFDGELYLFASTTMQGGGLWKTDGTQAGTMFLDAVTYAGPTGWAIFGPEFEYFVEMDGVLYFAGKNRAHGDQLWRSDGTPAGTYLVGQGHTGSLPYGLVPEALVGGYLVLQGFNEYYQSLYWVSDGTPGGTHRLRDSSGLSIGTGVERVLLNNVLYFVRNSSLYGSELWATSPPPSISASTSMVTYTEGGPPVRIAPSVVVSDPDSTDFEGGHLSVWWESGETPSDRLGVRHQGNGAGQVGVLLNDVSYEGVLVGKITGYGLNSPLVISFNSNSSPAAAQAALRAVEFENTSKNPPSSVRTLNIRVSDGGFEGSHSVEVVVFGVNDPPSITLNEMPLDYLAGAPPTPVDASAIVSDPDSGGLSGGTLSVSLSGATTAGDRLGIENQGSGAGQIGAANGVASYEGTPFATYSFGSGATSLTITFTSASTLDGVEALVRAVTFHNPSADASTGVRTVDFALTDGDGGSSPQQSRQVKIADSSDASDRNAGTCSTQASGQYGWVWLFVVAAGGLARWLFCAPLYRTSKLKGAPFRGLRPRREID